MILTESSRPTRDGSIVNLLRVERPKIALPADGADLQEFLRGSDHVREIDAMIRRQREEHVHDLLRLAKAHPELAASVPGNAYVVNTGASAIALAAATAKTILMLISGAANQPSIMEWCVSFDGVTSSAVPALVEEVLSTQGAAGTTTAFTPLQRRGWPVQTSANTAANNYTVEPTTLTMHKPYLVTPNGGILLVQYPLGREATGIVTAATAGKGLGYRVTAPAIVNVRGYLEYEE